MSDQESEELQGVAIIGMAGRFPGADSIEEYWKNLVAGKETIQVFSPAELDPSLVAEEINDPDYVPARGTIADADQFDAAFFGISAREAEIMDPQNRVFLQTAWEALERSGYCPEGFDGLISVFAGMANNTYYPTSVMPRPQVRKRLGDFQIMLANEKDFLATRVSHKLNLTGPSVSLYTGCSTSLVATCQAFDSLLSYQSDMALAGGICITCPQKSGYLYREDGIEAVDGHCRPFDEAATGTVFSNGVGIVVLKRLQDAIDDRDHIHAVLIGAALNNDGADKVSFAAPSMKGQADVIAMAQAQAGVDASSIGYVEAHGTATQLGDPIEFEGLKKAFQYPRFGSQHCVLGSVKGNFGHLLAASGVAGLIKAALAIEKQQIPPTLHFNKPNPNIDLDNSPFSINTRTLDWNSAQQPRRACVSSFGIGGTNAHVILEQAPAIQPVEEKPDSRLFLLSARNENALQHASDALADHVVDEQVRLSNVAFTLQCGRRTFPHRLSVVASTPKELAERLRKFDPAYSVKSHYQSGEPQVIFMLPGHGTQYRHMGQSLYESNSAFRHFFDECAALIREFSGISVTESLFEQRDDEDSFSSTVEAQCGLFSLEYALAQWLMSLGVKPRALIGYSVGEWVAACVGGVISLQDAVHGLIERANLLERTVEGTLLAVRLSAQDLKELCGDEISVAADNAPTLSVASGTIAAIAELEGKLNSKNIPSRRLPAERPFHSELLKSTLTESLSVMSKLRFSRPRIPIISTVTGNWINPQDATDPVYWSRHHQVPVLFRNAVSTAAALENPVFLELGPGQSLASCVAQIVGKKARVASILPDQWSGSASESSFTWLGLSKLWHEDVSIDWKQLHDGSVRRTVLPTYPFETASYWLEAVAVEEWLRSRGQEDI